MPTMCALFKLDMQTKMFLGLIHATQAICKFTQECCMNNFAHSFCSRSVNGAL